MKKRKKENGPLHIRKVLDEAKRQWMESKMEELRNAEEFRAIQGRCPEFIQLLVLYIDGDPNYVRPVFLN